MDEIFPVTCYFEFATFCEKHFDLSDSSESKRWCIIDEFESENIVFYYEKNCISLIIFVIPSDISLFA